MTIKPDGIDWEWYLLILEAKELGLTVNEVRNILKLIENKYN